MRERLLAWLESVVHLDLPLWLVPDQTMLVAVGFLASAVAAVWLARRDGLPMHHVALGLVACFAVAIVGSRVMAAALRLETWTENPLALIDLRRGGSSSIGALVGGCVAWWVYARRTGIDLWAHADAMVPAAGLGLGFARLGCFVHGCDFGRMTALPWGVRYPVDTVPFDAQQVRGFVGPYQIESLPVAPFQLALASFGILIFVVFALAPRLGRGRMAGDRALVAAALYFGGRFALEFLRSPWTSPMLGLLNLPQWLCLGSLVVLFVLFRLRHRAAASAAAAV